jgi:cell wall-associated NlpC family hydrolase
LTNGIIPTSSTSTLVARRSTPRTDPIRTGPIDTVTTSVAVPATRRAARDADRAQVKAARPGAKKTAVSVVVMTLTAGLIGTMALPAFALNPSSSSNGSSSATAALNSVRANGAQSVAVGGSVADASVARDDYTTTLPVVKKVVTPTTTTASTLTASQSAAATTARASFAASTAYSGKTASDYLADPSHPAFSLAAVYQTALKYVGTPYVFGGATPSGFDCSGFVMYVYAQYGISLAHSVPLQSAAGTTISQADAEPGDIVVLNNGSHDGFYAGNGMILDAPKPGGRVSVRPLWTSDVHFVRFGIK